MESDKIERKRIFKELLVHISLGYSLDCFPVLSDISIKEFVSKYPEEFVEEELIEAMRSSKLMWEDIGKKQSIGTCLGNSRSWYYNMVNRFGWRERMEVEAEHKGTIAVQVVSYASTREPSKDNEKPQRT
jgi:hypothetical protein